MEGHNRSHLENGISKIIPDLNNAYLIMEYTLKSPDEMRLLNLIAIP